LLIGIVKPRKKSEPAIDIPFSTDIRVARLDDRNLFRQKN